MDDLASFEAKVHGRVHGVFFRTFVQRWAEQLKLAGYVRNLPDGTVEVRAEGERQQLEKLVGYLQKGPPPARVDNVVTGWAEYSGLFTDFRVRY
ncbi:MAG TPA: acylphosphatase [Dehalococcoidales bacterium]|nr:acylphosphatase [Dehalococcoidales bacterium]